MKKYFVNTGVSLKYEVGVFLFLWHLVTIVCIIEMWLLTDDSNIYVFIKKNSANGH